MLETKIADEIEAHLQGESLSSLAEETKLGEDFPEQAKIRFNWRPEDKAILDRIRAGADRAVNNSFAEVFAAIDDFHLSLRVPRLRDGVLVRDASGRVVWETNDQGQPLESWDRLTGQDVETVITRLLRLRVGLSAQVNELMLEAVYARRVASDVYDDAWGKILDGTQGDRSAKANVVSRSDRYHAFFRFYLYSTAKVLLDEVNALVKHLENVRYWNVRAQQR